ncbi:di/tripeptidase [Actinokineospora baliensis]|uniref:PE domain-containing protein n=1 Tax=Actinokineospora baliensis TaxID=547056 RepID=UPI00195D833E|nr:PE domain-containing protein [Actinokineospora baliensis]MBM7770797.1 di/tripeptidase [Actinokineospora baliensis]
MTDATQTGAIAAVLATAHMAAESLHRTTATSAGQFLINHDNVLAAAKVIQTQIDTLQPQIDTAIADLEIAAPGEDEVSLRVAQEWNDRLVHQSGSYSVRVAEYITGLRNLVNQLKDSARAYGYSDDEIRAALGAAGA